MRFAPTTFEISVTGAGHPVVFIPGFACSGRVWEPIVGQLQGVEAHVISFAGFAGVPPVGEPSLARIHAELERYILDSGLAEAIVVGHSLGGHMALWLAETLPSLGGAVDVEGFPFLAGVDDPTMTQARAESAVRSKVDKFQAMTQPELESWVWQNMSGMFTAASDRERVLTESARSDLTTIAQLFGEGVAKDLRADLNRINAPVTVVVASAGATPDADLEARWRVQTTSIPHVELAFMAGSHFIMYDQPAAFIDLLDSVVSAAKLSATASATTPD